MRILPDTSYLYKLMAAPKRFSDAEWQFFDEHGARLYVSAASIWEMRLKYQSLYPSGERKSPYHPNNVIDVLEELGVEFIWISPGHAARELQTPISHKDPFDELLLVQVQEDGLKLLTVDRRLIGHPLAITL